ncbi:hypothetical protein LCGC14_2185970 [marine sediment metagenome]|uniref:Uncharacterized protein n=1 Tax=marine sediment metagenome TaxID=412755 RepID=A0A0F9DL65_9ZZZZ
MRKNIRVSLTILSVIATIVAVLSGEILLIDLFSTTETEVLLETATPSEVLRISAAVKDTDLIWWEDVSPFVGDSAIITLKTRRGETYRVDELLGAVNITQYKYLKIGSGHILPFVGGDK